MSGAKPWRPRGGSASVAKTNAQRQAEYRARKKATDSELPDVVASMLALTPADRRALLRHLEVAIALDKARNEPGNDGSNGPVTDRNDPRPPGSRARVSDQILPDSDSPESLKDSSSSPSRSLSSSPRASERDRYADRYITDEVTHHVTDLDEATPATRAMAAYKRAIERAGGVWERNEGDRPHFEAVASLAARLPKPAEQLDAWATRYVKERTTRSPRFFAEHVARWAQSGPRVHGRLLPAADPGDCDDSDIEEMPRKRRAHG